MCLIGEELEFEKMRKEIEELSQIEASPDDSFNLSNSSNILVSKGIMPKKVIAFLSVVLGSLIFGYKLTQPVSGVTLLKFMEKDSVDIKVNVIVIL